MKKLPVILLATLLMGTLSSSCNKNNGGESNPVNRRKIKYELTGNFSGKLDVLYSDNVNGNTALTDVALPWAKEIQYAPNVQSAGIGAQAKTAGLPGQTATIKIYSNGAVVRTSSATAGASGQITLPAVAYTF